MLVGKVEELFAIADRGLAVVIDTTYDQLPIELPLKVGDLVEFRTSIGPLVTRVAGIEHSDPWTAKMKFAFLVSSAIDKIEIPIGAEVWTRD